MGARGLPGKWRQQGPAAKMTRLFYYWFSSPYFRMVKLTDFKKNEKHLAGSYEQSFPPLKYPGYGSLVNHRIFESLNGKHGSVKTHPGLTLISLELFVVIFFDFDSPTEYQKHF